MRQTQLKIFGNVLDVLEGRVSSKLLRSTKQANFRFALGGSTFSSEHCIGETLIIEGTPYISWVQDKKLHTDKGSKALTPFLMGIDNDEPLGPLFRWDAASQISLQTLYGKFAEKYPKGIALVGSALMTMFNGVYLKRAPIYHENINQLHETYWSSIEDIPQALICLFGVIIPSTAKKIFPQKILERAFYQNPLDHGENLFESHTHAALVNKLVAAENSESLLLGLKSLQVSSVYHTLTQSILQKGVFTLFPLDDLVTQ